MKILDLLNAQPALQSLMDRKMPSKLAYGFGKNIRLINQELEDYNKARLKMLEDNWPFNQETNKYDIPDEEQEKWKKMHGELVDAECDYQPYKIDLTLTETVEMTPGEFSALWFIFQD